MLQIMSIIYLLHRKTDIEIQKTTEMLQCNVPHGIHCSSEHPKNRISFRMRSFFASKDPIRALNQCQRTNFSLTCTTRNMQKKYWFSKLSASMTLTPRHQVRIKESMIKNSFTILGLKMSIITSVCRSLI